MPYRILSLLLASLFIAEARPALSAQGLVRMKSDAEAASLAAQAAPSDFKAAWIAAMRLVDYGKELEKAAGEKNMHYAERAISERHSRSSTNTSPLSRRRKSRSIPTFFITGESHSLMKIFRFLSSSASAIQRNSTAKAPSPTASTPASGGIKM